MNFKVLKFYLFFFLIFKCYPTFSNNNIQKIDQFLEIKNITDIRDQLRYFHREIYNPNNSVDNIEEWITYFSQKKITYKEDNEVIYLNFILVYLYMINNDLDKAIDLGLTTYYSKFRVPEINQISCELLGMLEVCYQKKDNNLELLRINKEKFKVCDKRMINYHSVYFKMGLFDLALKTYKEFIEFNTLNYKKYNLYDRAFHNNDFGVFYMYGNKIDSALYHYNKSISLFKEYQKDSLHKKSDTNFMLSVVNGNIATCLLYKKEYFKAIPLYLKEIKASKLYYRGRDWEGSEKLYNRIAYCYIKTNQLKKAKKFINKLKKYKNLYYKINSDYYNQFNNIDSTLYFKDKYIKSVEFINQEKIKQQGLESLNAIEASNKINNQKEKITVLEKEDEFSKNKLQIISVTFFIFLFFFFLMLYYYLEKNKKQLIVEKQKNEIEESLESNRILLKELNHRVKNNLQMVSSVISLQSTKIKDDNSKKHFDSAVNRIKVLSKIHNSLYSRNQLTEIDLKSYILILKDYLVNSVTNPETNVQFEINIAPNLFISNDKKTTIGLIINELITNSYKYAFKNNDINLIQISISKKDNNYAFSYTDNGIGFNYEKVDKSKSVGLNLILRLINQLGDDGEINAVNGFSLNFNFTDYN